MSATGCRVAQRDVRALAARLAAVDVVLGALATRGYNDQLAALAPHDRAQMAWVVAYSLNTLLYIYARMRGVLDPNHAVMREAARVEAYARRVATELRARAPKRDRSAPPHAAAPPGKRSRSSKDVIEIL